MEEWKDGGMEEWRPSFQPSILPSNFSNFSLRLVYLHLHSVSTNNRHTPLPIPSPGDTGRNSHYSALSGQNDRYSRRPS